MIISISSALTISKGLQNKQVQRKNQRQTQQQQQQQQQQQENKQEVGDNNPTPEEYVGPYNENIDGEQYFVFVIPVLDIDQPAFVSGIEEFNLASYANLNLKVEVQQVDEIRQIVRITGLPDKETAALYFTKVVNNRDLYVPLRKGTYRNFLATEANYNIFLKEKNILDYMNFYKRFYLGQ